MQNRKIAIALIAVLAFAIPGAVWAQVKTWTWAKHNLKFQLPANWTVKEAGKKGYFLAKGPKGGVMKISPWQDRRASAQSVAEKALATYSFIENKQGLKQKELKPGTSGLERYIIFGKGVHKGGRKGVGKGRSVTFGIIGLTNPKSTANAYVRFWWFTDSPQAKILNRETYKIAQSFSAIK